MISFKVHKDRLETLVNRRRKPVQAKEVPDDALCSCPNCRQSLLADTLADNGQVCPVCGHHFPIDPVSRLRQLFDPGTMKIVDASFSIEDAYGFPGYAQKLEKARKASGLQEAVCCAIGAVDSIAVAAAVMDRRFMMGSMSAAVGEKIVRLIERAQRRHLPLVIFCASGGARMQEGIRSLAQMGRTASALAAFQENGGLYISVLTDPTTGGVSASFASLGDLILAEPDALVGFAGRRVIEQTTREVLPEGFQKAEFLQEKGFVDAIVPRGRQKAVLSQILQLHGYQKASPAQTGFRTVKRGNHDE